MERYKDFCASRWRARRDRARLGRGPDFDGLLVDTVRATFPAHEHDQFVAHYRGLLSPGHTTTRIRLLPVVRGRSRVCDAPVTRMRAVVTSLAALLAVPVVAAVPAQAAPPTAAGAPGALSHFDLARKDCVGTARNTTSKVWFTVADGVLSDVYEPTIDNTNVETMQYVGHRRRARSPTCRPAT